MNTTLVLQGILGFVFLMAGGAKLAQTREKVIASGGKWAEDFSQPMIKGIGAVEVLIALGLILPLILNFPNSNYLALAAAIGAMLIMAGAFATHVKRNEKPLLAVTGVIFLLGGVLAYLLMPR